MASSRAYAPSYALLRALSRPQVPACQLARRAPATCIRGKRTQAAADKPRKTPPNPKKQSPSPKQISELEKSFESFLKDDAKIDRTMRPLSDKELESDDLPVINWYEQDLDTGRPRRLISRLATAEDRKKDQELLHMIEESHNNPEYDSANLHRRLMDTLLANPNFADLTQELKAIKEGIKTKEELAVIDAQDREHAEREGQDLNASLKTATYQTFQDLIQDPNIGDAKAAVQKVLDKLPTTEDVEDPGFQDVLHKALAKLDDNKAIQAKYGALVASETTSATEADQLERKVEETIKELESDDSDLGLASEEELQDVNSLLMQMRDVLKAIGGDPELEAELDAELKQDPDDEQDGVFEREMDVEELAEELKKMVQKHALKPPVKDKKVEEDVPAELQAKVDKIMEDPQLMQKLAYIQQIIAEAEREKFDLRNIAHEVAPDPYKLESARTTTLEHRMQLARSDPEHMAAIRKLRVRLHPPFNISPALKSFNQAIEFAYIGANDDIRRILWRSYQKARTLPTFLHNVSAEAWDILYYSQAVTWSSNQNRQDHLRVLLKDLQSVGHDGPPTHPSTLIKSGQENDNDTFHNDSVHQISFRWDHLTQQ